MDWPQLVTAGFVAAGIAVLVLMVLARRREPQRWIVVDGSNVLYWAGPTPQLAVVALVLRNLEGQGFAPVVWFDANVGQLVAGRYLREAELAGALGLKSSRVFIADKGTPADPWLLAQARDLKAHVVSNDRYRDHAGAHPEVLLPGYLIQGRILPTGAVLDPIHEVHAPD